ncbi:superoxide dismutase [Chloroflexota bacterium]
MAHKLPDLPYDYSALEPHIDTRTLAVHHDKHHAAYVNNLNKALEGQEELQDMSTIELLVDLDAIPEGIRTAVRNNGGGHLAHSLLWTCLGPKGGGEPGGGLAEAIENDLESFDDFQQAFTRAAATVFGSGWVWLCVGGEGALEVVSTPGHDTPLLQGLIPILVIDVWEHAYYLKYENRRADYIAAWWNTVDWKQVSANYSAAKVQLGLGRAAEWARTSWAKLEDGWSKLGGS